jgi:hypothetical protein
LLSPWDAAPAVNQRRISREAAGRQERKNSFGRDEQLRKVDYRVELLVWIGPNGRMEKFDLVRVSGDLKIDALIREGLAQVRTFRQQIPQKLPQPMRIRVTSTRA